MFTLMFLKVAVLFGSYAFMLWTLSKALIYTAKFMGFFGTIYQEIYDFIELKWIRFVARKEIK